MSFLKNRTVVGVICILLSLLICFGLTPLFNQSISQKAEIVRVVQPIRAGDEITESMVQIVEVGGYIPSFPTSINSLSRSTESTMGTATSSTQRNCCRRSCWASTPCARAPRLSSSTGTPM